MYLLKLIPKVLRQKHETWSAEQQAFIKRTNIYEEYFFNDVEGTGTLYTKKQVENITDENLVPLSINFIYPIIRHAIAVSTHQNPSFQIISSYFGDDKELSQELDGIARAVNMGTHAILKESKAMLKNEEIIKMFFIRGKGIGTINKKKTYVNGEYSYRYEDVHPSNIILDPNNTSRDFNEGEGYFTETELTYDRFLFQYSDVIKELNEVPEDTRIKDEWIITTGDIDPKIFCKGINSRTNNLERNRLVEYKNQTVVVSDYVDKIYTTKYLIKKNDVYEWVFVENMDEIEAPLLSKENIVDQKPGLYVRHSLMFGKYLVQIFIEDITVYPAETLDFEWGGKTYKVYSLIHFMKGMQEGYDKFIQLMILNGILVNNAGWVAPINSIPTEYEENWETVDPRVIKFFKPIEIGDEVLVPHREQVQQLSNFYPLMAEMLKGGMEYVSSINSMMQGNPEKGIEVFSAIKTYYNFAMEKVMLIMRHINQYQMNLGEIAKQYVISDLQAGKSYFAQAGNKIGHTNLSVDQINKLRQASLTLIATPVEALPSVKQTVSQALFNMGQAAADPVERKRFADNALRLSGIPEAEEIVEEANVVQQMQGRLKDLEDENKRYVELLKQSQNRYINAKEQAIIAQRMTKFFETVAKAEAKLSEKLTAIGIIKELEAEIANLTNEESSEEGS